jgi:hypothetical protein
MAAKLAKSPADVDRRDEPGRRRPLSASSGSNRRPGDCVGPLVGRLERGGQPPRSRPVIAAEPLDSRPSHVK